MKVSKTNQPRSTTINHLLRYVLYGFFIAASANLAISCWDNLPQDQEENDEEKVDKKKINSDADAIQQIFLNADTASLANTMTETTLTYYREYFTEIQPYMNEFAKAIEKRKLIFANAIYAIYSYEANGKTYTFEMTLGDDGNWKLTRF